MTTSFNKNEAKRVTLKWDIQSTSTLGLFEATLWDGLITDVRMCKNGSSLGSEALYTTIGSEEFLREVHRCLGELLEFLDENKNK